jgi:hypothetical protein
MDEIIQKEKRALWIKGFVLLILLGGTLVFLYSKLGPTPKAKFAPLPAFTYESLGFSDEKLEFPSSDIKEIQEYFKNNPKLGWTPPPLGDDGDYQPQGGLILDYEVVKIAATKWEHKTKKGFYLFHYVFEEDWDQIPSSVETQEGSLTYRSYSSQELNLIAWKEGPLVHFLAGQENHAQLARMVRVPSAQ